MWGFRRVFAVMFPLAALIAGGCTESFFPVSGPNSIAIRSGNSDAGQQYAQVRLTPQVVNILDEYGARTIANIFGDKRPPPEVKFGIGDIVAVTIFEAAAGGLFIPSEAGVRPGNFITLPNQPIDTQGNIAVPYAGAVRAAGRTPSQVQAEIVNRINGPGD